MDAAQRRIDEVLGRVRHLAANGEFQVLAAGTGHARDHARLEAELVAESAGRTALVDGARDEVRSLLEQRWDQFHPRLVYGWAANTASAEDRVELSTALEDLVLAVGVEDLLSDATYATLSGDGSLLLTVPAEVVSFAEAGIEEGGPVDPEARIVPSRLVARLAAVGVVIVGLFATAAAWAQTGMLAGLLVAALALVIAFTLAFPPGKATSEG